MQRTTQQTRCNRVPQHEAESKLALGVVLRTRVQKQVRHRL